MVKERDFTCIVSNILARPRIRRRRRQATVSKVQRTGICLTSHRGERRPAEQTTASKSKSQRTYNARGSSAPRRRGYYYRRYTIERSQFPRGLRRVDHANKSVVTLRVCRLPVLSYPSNFANKAHNIYIYRRDASAALQQCSSRSSRDAVLAG